MRRFTGQYNADGKEKRREARMSDLNHFSVRTANCLYRMGLTRRVDILRAVKNRTLHPSNVHAHNFGEKSLREVREWLGLRQDITGQQIHYHRARFAVMLKDHGLTFREISRVMRFRGPGEAQAMVASGQRRLREAA